MIHVVGPRNGEGKENEKLRSAINKVLNIAQQNDFKSISIPAISTGIFGFPKDKCTKILIEESLKFVKNQGSSPKSPEIIEFCIYDDETLNQFKKEFNGIKER